MRQVHILCCTMVTYIKETNKKKSVFEAIAIDGTRKNNEIREQPKTVHKAAAKNKCFFTVFMTNKTKCSTVCSLPCTFSCYSEGSEDRLQDASDQMCAQTQIELCKICLSVLRAGVFFTQMKSTGGRVQAYRLGRDA